MKISSVFHRRQILRRCYRCRACQGIDPRGSEATPACVNSLLSVEHSIFGDRRPDSPASQALAKSESFRMHEDAGTDPGFYYIWCNKPEEAA